MVGKKILIMGLPGSGKTTLAEKLQKILDCPWYNADQVRKDFNDWDFTKEGRIRQANRMKKLCEDAVSKDDFCIVDFVCPTEITRKDFNADFIIWMDTIEKSRYEDTNTMFEPPSKYDYKVKEFKPTLQYIIGDILKPYTWNNRKPTAQMLGRWQPWHKGHHTLFEEMLTKTGQVQIMVRDVEGVGDNPFDFNTVKENIDNALSSEYKDRYKIILVPNITYIGYGRKVGYKIEEIVLPQDIQKISATDIRNKMRLNQ